MTESKLLSEQEQKLILYNYAVEICTSNPIKCWNWTELIEHFNHAQASLTRSETLKEAEKLFTKTNPNEPQNCWLVEKSEWLKFKEELK